MFAKLLQQHEFNINQSFDELKVVRREEKTAHSVRIRFYFAN